MSSIEMYCKHNIVVNARQTFKESGFPGSRDRGLKVEKRRWPAVFSLFSPRGRSASKQVVCAIFCNPRFISAVHTEKR